MSHRARLLVMILAIGLQIGTLLYLVLRAAEVAPVLSAALAWQQRAALLWLLVLAAPSVAVPLILRSRLDLPVRGGVLGLVAIFLLSSVAILCVISLRPSGP